MNSAANPTAGRGRLAQLLATRGGTAAPEAPFVIEHREALIYMLCEAAELEHAIMCQYLFAAFSLKESVDEGLTDDEFAAVSRWRRQISHVATQEMLHLALVHNVLSAIGAAPHLGRPNMPHPANHYPPGVQLRLLAFGEDALRHFMFLERPEGMSLDDAEGLEAVGRTQPAMADADIVPRLQDFATVGHLYRSIEEGLAHLSAKFGERGLFLGPAAAQATQQNFSWPELICVTDLESAQQAISAILEQGEGPRGAWQNAHFGQFVSILDEYYALREANPDFEPARPVSSATVRPLEHDDSIPLITDPASARCTDLFNVAYEVLLQTFERYFAHTEETDAQLGTLAQLTLSLMFQVIKPLGSIISTLPVGPEHPGRCAGPSFELFYESDYLMPHRGAAWEILEERLREAAEFCERIRARRADADLGERLAPIGPALVAMAESLAAHYPEWGGRRRWPKPGDAAAQEESVEELVAQSRELIAGATPSGVLAEAHRLVEVAGANSIGDDVVARLVHSVVRPLSAAGFEGRPSDDPSGGRDVQTFADRLVALADAATSARAEPTAPSGLIEAVAALQDIAVGTAEPGARSYVEALFGERQAALPPDIQVSADGPYLVTNATNLRNWLGEALPVTPQMALCRCGESKLKPLCDGTHARIGFSGTKDPNRVPDKRDTYVGEQITVFDNRGICQHSGLCTDRLPTAFRADSEPFVAPSGGRMDEIIRAVRDCPSGALSYAINGVEARRDVDRTREPSIEVSKNGPYRITGGITLRGPGGELEARAEGSSTEHYALCRCGHSQNKPFCSGMHWYVSFTDPVPDAESITLFSWAGGIPALTRTARFFYEKHIPSDSLLARRFAEMPSDQPERLAALLAQTFGGPGLYSERYAAEVDSQSDADPQPGLPREIALTTEAERRRWVELLVRAADDAKLPDDAAFRSAFGAYVEWASRQLMTDPAASESTTTVSIRGWDWGPAGPPSIEAATRAQQGITVDSLPDPDDELSFEQHIKPLFRSKDRDSMSFAFDLWSYTDVAAHAEAIVDQLRHGSMPCDGAWPTEAVAVFQRWIDEGEKP